MTGRDMAQSSHSCSVSSLTQRLKRQSLTATPGSDGREERPEANGIARATPNARRQCDKTRALRLRANASKCCDNTDGADENVGPEPASTAVLHPRGIKRDDRSPPKPLPPMVPRPMQSAGLPSMSVSAFPSPSRELSLSARDPVLRPHRSPPLAPPLKRFCRSLTEDLPRPTPLRPVVPGHANADYLRSLIARRLRSGRVSQPASPASSFSSTRSSFRRWTSVSSGYSSCGSLLADVPEPEPGREKESDVLHVVESHLDPGRSDFFHGGRRFLCGLPELQQQVSPSLPPWLSPNPLLPNEEDTGDEEEEVTLREDTRWSSPCGLEGLDLDSMEKDESWKL